MSELNKIPRFDTHAHSEYSNIRLIDSINRLEDMILTTSKLGLKGLVLTDHETVAGHVRWLNLEKELKEKGKIPQDFKCGCGNEIYLVDDRNNIEKYWHYILIAKNTRGHKALRELSSIAWYNCFTSRGMTRVPTEKKELIEIVEKYKGDLISTTSCLGGELPGLVSKLIKAEKEDISNINQIKEAISDFIIFNKNLFGEDFYIEIAAAKSKEQIAFNKRIGQIAKAFNTKIVIGSDAHYLTSKERDVHRAYLNSKNGEREVDSFYFYSHMMDNEEAFSNLEGIFSKEEFLDFCSNSMEIYSKIETYEIFHESIISEVKVKNYNNTDWIYNDFQLSKSNYPILKKLIKSENSQERYWLNQCLDSLVEHKLFNEKYLQRLEVEADIVDTVGQKKGICVFKYFNTFQHYINLFWEMGSIVGPGRGSSACFLSNFLLGITQVDSIEWNLKEWRFINKERIELPDIDIDLAPSKRKAIFDAIREERGEINVVQVCTFGTEGSRSAVLAAARGYRSEDYPDGIDIETAQYLSGLIPQERGVLRSIKEVVYGNEEKEIKPIKSFVQELEKYPGLLEIIISIEGLVNKRSIHASGVMLYNESPFETNALMRSPNGDLTTQFSLKDSELLGDTKFDFLVTEICDKITTCIELLKQNGFMEKELSLREIYNKYLHPKALDLSDDRLWTALAEGTVLDVFQFSTGVGLAAAKLIKPQNPIEMMSANAIMRLMGEKGKERPLDRYARLKNDISQWYKEMEERNLSKEEIGILEEYCLESYGVPALQEDLMEICMDERVSNFSLKEANDARKIVAKKNLKKVPELKEKFLSRCPNTNFAEYVWEIVMMPQMAYAFAKPHCLVYSFVGIQTLYLATNFPSVFWNCACLTVNAGGAELLELDENEVLKEETPTVKKNKSVDYGKISTAIGEMQKRGIKLLPPNINKSNLIFSPDLSTNSILYGIKGISKVGTQIVYNIIENRPYSSITDFLEKVKVNKAQMVSLIKAGCFDEFYGYKELAMKDYLGLIADKKKRITLQNMQMLIKYNLVPEEYSFQIKVFNFNRYLKKFKDGNDFKLNEISLRFYTEHYSLNLLRNVVIEGDQQSALINQKQWDNIYQKEMDTIRTWMKANQQEILTKLNNILYTEIEKKYSSGSISKWEMESLGFYHHSHELENLKTNVYEVVDFFELPETPEVDRTFEIDGKTINLYKISRIAGTVIDKDKNKSSVTLLTTNGVVNVKVWKNQFSLWDKQLARRNPDGTKTVVEKSWFTRGTKLILTGIRRDDTFVPKKYKSTEYPLFEKIEAIDEEGFITKSSVSRVEVE